MSLIANSIFWRITGKTPPPAQKLPLTQINYLTRTMNDEELLKAENERLKAQNEELLKALAHTRTRLRRAKNPDPINRPSFKRVIALVQEACMTLTRLRSGWQLSMGRLKRKFRFLRQIWDLLIEEDWFLGHIFPPTPSAPTRRSQRRPRLPFRSPILASRSQTAPQVVPALSG